MYKLFQVMRLDENVCLTTYFNAFDSKTAYTLRDKDPKTLRDAFKIAVNIANNRRASRKLGRGDDPKLFNPWGSKKEGDKLGTTTKPEEDKMDQVLNLVKNLKPIVNNVTKPNTGEKPQFNNNFNRQTRLQSNPYNTMERW